MSEQVVTAFGMLIEAINEEKSVLTEVTQNAVMQGNYDKVRSLINKTEQVEEFTKQIEQLKKDWQRLYQTINGMDVRDTRSPSHIDRYSKVREPDTNLTKSQEVSRADSDLVGQKIPHREMLDRVNAYRRYHRLLYIISARHLQRYKDSLGIRSSEQFAVFRKEGSPSNEKYYLVTLLDSQSTPTALCTVIDKKVCNKAKSNNGVNGSTFARGKTAQWDYSEYPVPSIEELVNNINDKISY